VPTLVVYVVIATVAGLLAALVPARRAARLDVLEAITHM
jgi:putative ABC transport system permease protein